MTYVGHHAALYDFLYVDKDYRSEALFVANQLRSHARTPSPPINLLDIACGTASHALVFEELGFDVVGIDASENMLAVARQKIADAGARVRLWRQDMRTLDAWSSTPVRFDAAACLFDSIGHAGESSDVRHALSGIANRLVPGGCAVFEFWHGPGFVRGFERHRIRRLSVGGEEVIRISETDVNLAQQIAVVRYEFHVQHRDGRCSTSKETVAVRFFGVAEMADLLVAAGFEPIAFYDGFSTRSEISPDCVHVVGVARRPLD